MLGQTTILLRDEDIVQCSASADHSGAEPPLDQTLVIAILGAAGTAMLAAIGWLISALKGKASHVEIDQLDEKIETNVETIETVRKEAREDREKMGEKLDSNRREMSEKLDRFGIDLRGELRAIADRIERSK